MSSTSSPCARLDQGGVPRTPKDWGCESAELDAIGKNNVVREDYLHCEFMLPNSCVGFLTQNSCRHHSACLISTFEAHKFCPQQVAAIPLLMSPLSFLNLTLQILERNSTRTQFCFGGLRT